MTAIAATRTTPLQFPWRIVLAAALLASILCGVHAIRKHGQEARAIRQACDSGGQVQLWQALERPNKFYRVCQIAPGVFGLQIIECTKRGIRERSAFVLKATQHPAGSMARATEYLSAKAVQIAGGLCK